MKKSFIRRFISLSFALGLIFSATISYAAIPEPEYSVHGEECGACGAIGSVNRTKYVDTWRNSGETVECTKNEDLRDIVQIRAVYWIYRCNKCDFETTIQSSNYETKVLCTH